MRRTHTYAILEVPQEFYLKIRQQLSEAGYEHAFHNDENQEVIDMHGIALKAKVEK